LAWSITHGASACGTTCHHISCRGCGTSSVVYR
jgi:hypothetical protein